MSAVFMSQVEIIESIKLGEIRIAYYSILLKDGAIRKLAEKIFLKFDSTNETEDEKLVREYFLSTLSPDSFSFRVGPYAKITKATPWSKIPNTFN